MIPAKTILVAEDDSSIAEVLKIILTGAGYTVLQAGDEKQILALLKQKPSLLLLDIWISGSNGAHICARLKKNKGTSKLPILLISANRDTPEIAKRSGADGF